MTPNLKRARAIAFALLVATPAATVTGAGAQSLDSVLRAQADTDKAAAAAQQRINGIADETTDMAARYRQALSDVDSLKKYNLHLGTQVKSQQTEVASIQQQLVEIETTQREVQPLMQRMVDTLGEFVKRDVPFLLKERTERVQKLKDMMLRADVTISEKYRRILEAYQIELEFGRTLDSYEDTVGEGADKKTVEFVRLGRISLMYQTPDGDETAYWNQDKKEWVVDSDYAQAVREALRVAKKLGAPDLLEVPVAAPKEVQG